MMSIAEVVQDVGAITVIGITKLDYLAELAALQAGAAFDIIRLHTKLCSRSAVKHYDSASPAPVSVCSWGSRGAGAPAVYTPGRVCSFCSTRGSRGCYTLYVTGAFEQIQRRLHRHLVSSVSPHRNLGGRKLYSFEARGYQCFINIANDFDAGI